VLATYYECDYNREAMSDRLTEVMSTVYDRHLKAGHITSYGWSSHAMGGAWRRLGYFIGTDRGAMLDMWAGLDAEMTKEFPDASREFNQICGRHQDYLWNMIQSSAPDPARLVRADWTMSVYYNCNAGREERADELVKTVLAPAWDAHVKAGHLASFSWLGHSFGAGIRRTLVVDGPDTKSLLAIRDQVRSELVAKNRAALDEFSSICGGHQDYLWAKVLSKP
jgi:hypothetical protein